MSANKKQKLNDDRVSIPSQSDLDAIINKLNSSEDSSSSDDEGEINLKELKQDHLEDTVTGPEVDEELADLFNSITETGVLTKDKIALKAKEYPMPANCNLEVNQVNPEIWSNIIGSKDRSTDIQIQKSQKLVSKATYANLKIANSATDATRNKKNGKKALKSIIQHATDDLAKSLEEN